MLELRPSIKPIQSQKIAKSGPAPIERGYGEDVSELVNKKSDFSGALIRKKRSDDKMDVDEEMDSVFYSDKLVLDNNLQLTWYGENGKEKLKDNYRAFKRKIQQLLQSSMGGYPENEKFETYLGKRPYPKDYELGCLASLVYREDAGYEIFGLVEEDLELRLNEIAAEINRLGEHLRNAATIEEKKRYQAEKEILLTEQFTLLEKKSLKGWQLLGMASHPTIKNGYVGALYWQDSKKQVVIAHRGTQPTNVGSGWADLKGIMGNLEVEQMSSANTFSHLVIESLPVEIKSISFTGHSLGGWLAQITTFSSEYLERSGNYFKKRIQPIHHPHAVVFDSPGCQPMLLKLKRSFDLRYMVSKQRLNIHALDIRTYLSVPNMINTCHPHVGTLYRLFPDLRDSLEKEMGGETSRFTYFKQAVENYVTNKFFIHTIRVHKLKRMLDAWPKDEDRPTKQEVQEVQDWPIWSNLIEKQEYDQFFSKAKNFNSYHLDENTVTDSGFRIRYRTRPVDFRATNMRIFNAEERQFLASMKILQDWFIEQKGHAAPELHELNRFFQDKKLEQPVIADILQALKAYTLLDHGERLQIRDSEEQVIPLINGLKQLFRRYPDIVDVVKREIEKRPTLIQAIYTSESDRWINTLRDQIDLRWQINRDRLNLVNFLTAKEAKVLHITVDSEEMKLMLSQLAYDLLTAIGEKDDSFFKQLSSDKKVALAPYSHNDAVILLNVEQIRLLQNRGFGLNKFYRSEKSPPLLWLDGELTHEDIWQTELFSESLTKKIIVLTKAKGPFDQFLKHQPWGTGVYHVYDSKPLAWSDLTVESRQHVLERVTVQGEKNLARLMGFDTLADISAGATSDKLMSLNRILDIKTLMQLINNRIDIGSLPERFSHLEAAYAKSRDTLVISKLKEALLKDSLKEETTRYLIISGLFDPNINVVNDKLVQYLGLTGGASEIENIKSKVDFYDIREPGNKRIFIASDLFSEKDFKEFCRDYNPLELRVDWIHWKNNQFILQYLYDPEFYINRKFYYKDEIVILNKIKDDKVSLQIEDDLFIFSDVKFDKRSKFIIRLKRILQPFTPTLTEYVLEQFQKDEKVKNIHVTLASQDREALFKSFGQIDSIHWLKQDDRERLIWQSSKGSLEALNQYIDEARTNSAQELLSEENFINKINKNTALIIDEPGMGKTTALTKLSGSMLESNWVIRINPRSYEEAIKCLSSNEKITFSEVVEFLAATDHSGLGSDLAKSLIRYKLQHPNEGLPLLLLFDGFDEIKDDKKEGKKKVSLLLNFLKDKAVVWVTARKNEIKTLQNSLLVFDTKLEELDLSAQREFLKKFWYTRLFLTFPQSEGVFERKCKLYIEALLKEVNSAFRLNNPHLMGVPLQLSLLGEGFQEGFKEFINDESSSVPKIENINVLELYERFISAKYHLFLEKENVSGGHAFLHESVLKELNKMYRRLAFYQLIGDDVEVIEMIGVKPPFLKGSRRQQIKVDSRGLKRLFRVGIVQPAGDNSFEFIHKSFAEYFVAELLINQLKKVADHHNHARVQKHLLTNVLIEPEYQLIRVFLDEQLAKTEVLLPENLVGYSNAIEVFWTSDSGGFFNEQGQTALHVAVEEQYQKIFDFLLAVFRARPEKLIALVSVRDRNGDSALYLAIKQGKKAYARQFLESTKGCSEDVKQKLLLSTMFRTDEDDSNPVLKELLNDYIESYPEVQEIAHKIKSNWKLIKPFLEAAESGSLADYWNAHPLDENTKTYLLLATNKNRATALHLAITGNHVLVVETLLKKGADVDAEAQYIFSSVQDYNNLGHIQYDVKPLLHAVDPLPYGVTPLQMAVSQKRDQIAERLLEGGAKVNVGQGEYIPLYMAATLDNANTVKMLLLYGAEVDVQAPTGETPLYWAALHNNQDMADSLLKHYADVNLQTRDGFTPLYWAVSQNNLMLTKQLLKAGADINIGRGDSVPLYAAVRNNDSEMVITLLKAGASAEIKGDKGDTLLLMVIRDNLKVKLQDKWDTEQVWIIAEWLLSYGCDINVGQNDETPLYWAVRHDDERIIEMLLDWGAEVNVQLKNGETPLYWAVKNNRRPLVNKLLDRNADVNIVVKEEGGVIHTPLSLAAENQNDAIKNMLSMKNAQDDVERGSDYQLYFSIRTNDKAAMERLLGESTDVNRVYGGKTLLHWAIIYRRYEMVKILLHGNAQVNEKTANGDTALYLAIKQGLDNPVEASETIEMLLARDADINVKLRNFEPLLCWIIRKSVLQKAALIIVKRLLDQNPDVNVQSRGHETPLYLATRYGFYDVVDSLLERGVDVNVALLNGETVLYWAVRNNLDVVVDALLEREVDVNVALLNGETAFYWAVRNNSLDMVEKLLKHGANAGANASVNERVMNRTPLDWAEYYKYEAIVKKLQELGAKRSSPNSLKRNYEESEDYLTELKKSRGYYQNLEDCFPGPSGYHSSERKKRNAAGEGCEISWEDTDEFNEEKEKPREFSKIKINSNKFLDILKNPSLPEIKRTQLLQLADKATVTGQSKEHVYELVQHQKKIMYLNKIGRVSGMTMHGMIAKNTLRDFLQRDYEGVAINIGFIAGGQGLARVAEAVSIKGTEFVSSGRFLLGQSLRSASPFLARGTSVFIAYDFVNQMKAYAGGNSDAVVGIIGDSIYLVVDAAEIGIELAEIGGLLVGVSSVTGPIGATVGAVVFVGTDVYLAVKQVNQIDRLIHLTSKEKLLEDLRAFIGMKPEQYIERLMLEKQGNNQLYKQGVSFLKKHPNIQRYILPTVREEIRCIPKPRMPAQLSFHSNRRRMGIGVASDLQDKDCNIQLKLNLDNTIVLNNKKKDIKWGRTKPDVTEGSLFCAPVGKDLEIPSEGAYLCDKAMGIEWPLDASRSGNITFFELGDGNDVVVGFPQGNHIIMLGNGHKIITLGDGNDTFLLTGNLTAGTLLNGGGGINTLDLAPHAQPFEDLKGVIRIHNYLLRENKSDYIPSVACSAQYIDARGGKGDDLEQDRIIISEACTYSLKVAVRSYTHIRNYSANEKNQFTYLIPTTTNKGNSTVSLEFSKGSHQFVFAYELFDIYRLVKVNYNKRSVIKFSFKKNVSDTTSVGQNKFRVLIHCTDENKLSYVLGDNTAIKVVQDNFYAFQTTNRSIEDIIKDYPRVAERLNLSIFVQSQLMNESIAIGHGKHDVLSNDPYRRSHLIGNGGENIFIIRSGYKALDMSKLPVPEIVLYDKDNQNLIDTLDLREIRSQLEECFGVEIKARASRLANTNDIVIELFMSREEEKALVTVRLKDALETNWHQRLHIIVNHVLMELDILELKPLPLEFGSDKEIIVVSPENVEENMVIVIDKKLGDYHFYRFEDNLIMSNVFNAHLADSERYALSLQSFYPISKLQTLSIKFSDKEILLKDEMERIHKATSFILECDRYNQTLHDMHFNHKVTEESMLPARRSHARRSHHDIHEVVIEKKEVNKTIWGSVISCILPVIAGVGAVFGYRYQMRARLRANAMPVVYPAAIAAPLLAPAIEASSSAESSRFLRNMDGDSAGNFSLFKCVLHPFCPSVVERMNQVEDALMNRFNESMSSEQRVAKALKSYDVMNGTSSFEEMILCQAKSAAKVKSNHTNCAIGKNPVMLFYSGSVQPPIANDSRINDSFRINNL